MLDLLKYIDQRVFFFINGDLSVPLFDMVMPWLRNPYFHAPVYVFIIVFLIKEYERKGLYLICFLLLCFAVADYTSASIIKPFFNRLRPCNDPFIADLVKLRVGQCGGGKSFVSSHAANHFAIAFFLIGTFNKKWPWVMPVAFLWALSVCFAQVYVGVHYPFDVLCGGLFGSVVGYSIAQIRKKILPMDI